MNTRAFLAALCCAVLCACGRPGSPAPPSTRATHEGVHAASAWARATPPMATVGAVYLELDNQASRPDTLVSVSTPVAPRAEVHRTAHEDGMARMRPVSPFTLGAGERLQFGPGGVHLMLMDLPQPLSEGDRFDVTLGFEHAGEITVQVDVLGLTAAAHGHGARSHGETTR